MENKELNTENNNQEEKPFNFGKFILGIFLGLLILTSIIILVPYFLMK
ncbi:tRNA uridine 5-carboxymethylaminomethyl modification protein [Nautilia sp. PV-1]|nr:tRNA uridine 5-carboxymethylaminomethyl modification protein [Nautilia sp. PV-1]AZV46001.1 tRNA uridine 5-carboxymethylaminomethyl modification protein [Nautilia sp. PV-1]